MGFLDKLWDETLAGPAPEMGLGKIRKFNSFSAARSSNHPISRVASARYHHDGHDDQAVQVSRSITILRPKNLSDDPGSGSSTPSTGPSSPYSPGTPRDPDVRRFTRKKKTLGAMENATETSPTFYDWILISSLDR